MPEFENPEGVHVGQALLNHCGLLDLSLSDVADVAGPDLESDARWTVTLADVSVARLRTFHLWEIEAYERLDCPRALAMPVREQWYTTANDNVLYNDVMRAGRRTAWWWGQRRTARGSGAYCYVCSDMIHHYDLGRGVTHAVRLAVMTHRAEHIRQLYTGRDEPAGRGRS